MKIVAFAGSNSSRSINKKLVTWVSSLFSEHEVEILDLNDYEVDLYSIDREEQNGFPERVMAFSDKLADCDLILLSLAEHNGAYTVAFKNLLDWCSRIPNRTVFHDKPIFLMGTSPGKRGASTVLGIAEQRFQWNGGKVYETFSLPNFYDTFEQSVGIMDAEKKSELQEKVAALRIRLKNEK